MTCKADYDDFVDADPIRLQPGSVANSYAFSFPPAASASAKGAIPFGTNISSVVVTAWKIGGTEAAALINGTPTVLDNVVTVKLDWVAGGMYKLNFLLTLDDTSVWEKDYNHICCKDN